MPADLESRRRAIIRALTGQRDAKPVAAAVPAAAPAPAPAAERRLERMEAAVYDLRRDLRSVLHELRVSRHPGPAQSPAPSREPPPQLMRPVPPPSATAAPRHELPAEPDDPSITVPSVPPVTTERGMSATAARALFGH